MSHDEIKAAVFAMGALKASGPDGLNPLFFQSQWKTIGHSVVSFIQECVHTPEKIREVNDTLIVLIPKLDKPHLLSQYRPIGLCNVIYKTLTKVIANRLKGVLGDLISPNQCSFIPGRQSSDNIILA